ncbi:hypothetical protein ACHAPJ_008852 [Fusarium lateritium]
MAQPPQTVLEAFCITSPLVPVQGGRGLCFRADDIILRPSDDDEESEWVGSLCESLMALESTDYRTSRSILDASARYVFEGWTAWSYVSGKATPKGNFESILKACRAFNADVAKLRSEKPEFLSKRMNRFTEADLVTWEEKGREDVSNINDDIMSLIQPTLQRLIQLRQPFKESIKNQLIHGDLTGNILFDQDPKIPPGIIDITLYWRPAEYAEAIIIADGLIWLGEGRESIEMYGTDHMRLQLLVRALYWRCLAFAIDPDVAWVKENLPRADFGRAAEVVAGMVSECDGE